MRAAQFHRYGPPDVIEVDEVPRPDPPPGFVRVRVGAAALNPVDCKIRSGLLRAVVRHRLPQTTGLDLTRYFPTS